MCGLAGFIPSSKIVKSESNDIIHSMIQTLEHRGPDAADAWVDENHRMVMGFRRLAIQDLTRTGNQPMHSPSKRFTIVFNGEIYNHFELRKELEIKLDKINCWRGSSDTETILAAFEIWGIRSTLDRLHGMFAIAVYDKKLNTLTLARDRIGEKPLYYGIVNKSFVFASELKAIKKFPNFRNILHRPSIAKYLQYNFVPAPLSIYEGIYKVNPGSTLTIKVFPDSFQSLEQEQYWDIGDIAKKPDDRQTEDHILRNLEQSLSGVINNQMISDVPLGAFLSGGVDSSLIVSLMQAHSIQPIKTFTVGFEENSFDESEQAKSVAKYLKTDHTEVILGSKEAQDVIPLLPKIYDEPFADSSQIPTFLISKVAKQHVTVALSGDGGDEIFGGYNRYLWAPSIWNNIKKTPSWLRPTLSTLVRSIPRSSLPILQNFINLTQTQAGGIESLEGKITKLSRVMSSSSQKDFYNSLISHWPDQKILVKGLQENDLYFTGAEYRNFPENCNFSKDFITNMMKVDSMHYLPNDILCKLDRASMANSLETRAPFLDHKIIELAWELPPSLKINNGEGKQALRKILYQYVPKELIERPKTGFSIPIAQWLRGPLREWADSLLSKSRIDADGYLFSEPIQLIWNQHLSGRYDWSDRLWGVLMFQSWLDSN